jgi:hypothetical protein
MKKLVLGFATNQAPEDLFVFSRSVRKVLSPAECDVVLVTNSHQDVFSELAELEIGLFSTVSAYVSSSPRRLKFWNRAVLRPLCSLCARPSIREKFPEIAVAHRAMLEVSVHPHIARWFAYERFLSLNRQYDQVFLTDIRDVVFQASPFHASPSEDVWLFSQSAVYGRDDCDTNWFKQAFGAADLDQVNGKDALCIGTILGPHAQVLTLTRDIANFMAREPFGRVEQAIFNWMFYNGKITASTRVIENVSGPVATLSKPEVLDSLSVLDGQVRRASDNSLIPVVHMYDRHDRTRNAIEQSFGMR